MKNNIVEDIRTKIHLLCYGVRQNTTVEEIYSSQNPYDQKRTGNIGIQVLIGLSKLPSNIPVFNKFTNRSPYTVIKKDERHYIQRDDSSELTPIFIIKSPLWYAKDLGGRKAGEYLLQEGTSTLIASITENCLYANQGLPCAFCAINPNKTEDITLRQTNLLNSIEVALKQPNEKIYQSINLTGGNSEGKDRGIDDYKPYIKFIRTHSNIPICLELSPPSNLDKFKEFVDMGVNAFMMNIEIWDEKLRKLFMPAKSTIIKNQYIKAWEKAVELVGIGNVSSVIIVGLENEQSVKEAISTMTEVGVIPSIMPLRPNDGAILENFPITQPDMVFRLTIEAAKKMKQYTIELSNLPGCIGCGACAVECDIYANINYF